MATIDEKRVSLEITDGVALITMNDGKNNLVSPAMLDALNGALDEAERAGAVVLLTGREGVFSAGFDLAILRTGVRNTFAMLMGGFKLSRRLLAFPTPVVIACSGHAIAMGAFLLLSGDYRVGTAGDFRIVANEVEIGLTMPHAAIEICRQRLKPACLDRSVLLSEAFRPESALEAGFLDELVAPEHLHATAQAAAARYVSLDKMAHQKSKQRLRHHMLAQLDKAIEADRRDFIVQGVKRVIGV